MRIPAAGGLLEEPHDHLGRLGILSSQRAGFEQMLDRFRHVEPAAAQRRAQRQDALAKESAEQIRIGMSHTIIPDQQHAQRG
jgi:hypothetical protein